MVQTELTQREILEKDFASKLRGYDPQEVDEFLDIIIRDYKVFDNYIEDLKKENNRLSKSVETIYKRLEKATKKNQDLTKQLDELRSGSTKVNAQTDNQVNNEDLSSVSKEDQLKDQQEKLSQESRAQQTDDLQKTHVLKRPLSIQNPIKGSRLTHKASLQSSDQPQKQESTAQNKSSRPSATILDLLKRVSNLEKAVFGEEKADN